MNLSTALDKALDSNQKLEARFSKLNDQANRAAKRGILAGTAFAGSMTPGILRGALGDVNTGELKIPHVDVDVDMAMAGVAAMIGLFGVFGVGHEMADHLAVFGGSAGGAALGRELEDMLRARRKAA
jgi:hypothetical protein